MLGRGAVRERVGGSHGGSEEKGSQVEGEERAMREFYGILKYSVPRSVLIWVKQVRRVRYSSTHCICSPYECCLCFTP